MVSTEVEIAKATFRAAREHHEDPLWIFRLLPWTFPRAVFDDLPREMDRHDALEVETTDLLKARPTWSLAQPISLSRAMCEVRARWSRQCVQIAAPEGLDYGDVLKELRALRVPHDRGLEGVGVAATSTRTQARDRGYGGISRSVAMFVTTRQTSAFTVSVPA